MTGPVDLPLAGGSGLLTRAAVFSQDGKLLLIPAGRVVRVFSTATADAVGTLVGHTADVTCVAIDRRSASQARTSFT